MYISSKIVSVQISCMQGVFSLKFSGGPHNVSSETTCLNSPHMVSRVSSLEYFVSEGKVTGEGVEQQAC